MVSDYQEEGLAVTISRIGRVHALLAEQGLDAVMIQNLENRTYVSGFTGTAGVAVISPNERMLLVDFRYVERAGEEAPEFELIKADRQLIDTLVQVVTARQWPKLGFESDAVTVKQFREYEKRLAAVELVALEDVDRMRWVKEPIELEHIRAASAIADAGFAHVLPQLRPGVTERDVATELAFFMRRHGGDEAFEFIVASGPHSSRPHAGTTDRGLAAGDFVTLDFGARYRGYISDCTRTVVVGAATERQRDIYNIVLDAHQAAIRGLKPGMTGREGDALARTVIAKAGYGDAFGHAVGHGVGLAVHEGPVLSARSDNVLQPGMVVTVEPGIYLQGWGGVRIEDMVVITENGCQSLTNAPKTLLEV